MLFGLFCASEKKDTSEEDKRTVYEALIEDKGKNVIYLRLSSATVQALDLKVSLRFYFTGYTTGCTFISLTRKPICLQI